MRRLALALILLAAPAASQGTGPLDATGRAAVETGLDLAAASLANALVQSRDAAWAAGTQPMPPRIRTALLAWYPADLLDGIEYRVGIVDGSALQALSFHHGKADAMTLIDTIIFADAQDAQTNVALWGHEVIHVEQVRTWGVLGFARAYVRDHQAVEAEAYAIGDRIKASLGGG